MRNKGLFWLFISCLVLALYFLLAPFAKDYIWLIKSNPTSSVQPLKPSAWSPSQEVYENIHPPSLAAVLKANPPKEGAWGRVIAPQVKMDVSIYQMPTQANLLVGAATFYPDQVLGEGNTVLLGHHVQNPTSLFSPLTRIKERASIYLETDSKLQRYQVITKKVIPETDLTMIQKKKEPYLTLITCDTYRATTKRLIIQAKLVKEVAKVNKNKNTMQCDYEKQIRNLEAQHQQLVMKKTMSFILFGILLLGSGSGVFLYWKKIEEQEDN
ncbi:class A sortase [Listeria kieliensis]|uniref:Sortase n=1 Tax=Listeria kieliensis TaxID=1621700 RepID=A0A3D8TT68_9LIST|nr:class A sortase [Listeria kieliensis]RDX01006.1 hypothetical protein UR08_08590 [Listeria kieliensis]